MFPGITRTLTLEERCSTVTADGNGVIQPSGLADGQVGDTAVQLSN